MQKSPAVQHANLWSIIVGMAGSRSKSEQGVQLANRAGEVMLEIRDEAQRVVDAIGQFADAIQD